MTTTTIDTANLEQSLQPVMEILEKERSAIIGKLLNAAIITAAIVLIGCLLLFFVLGAHDKRLGPFLVAPFLVGAAVIGITYWLNMQSYRHSFKASFIARLVEAIGPDVRYFPQGSVPEGAFRACQLFRSPDRYNGEDLMEGTLGETSFQCSEVKAEYKTHNSKGQTQWHLIFRGLLFVADFNKHFRGTTVVLPDTAQRLLGGLGQSLQALGANLSFHDRELVKLEDPEFEKHFVVYGSDQVEARYILSPGLMRRLLEYQRQARCQVRVAFIANHIFVAVSTQTDLFEPPLFDKKIDRDLISYFLAQLRFSIGLVEELNLNTRIWSKQ